jgi:hypothetical protein
MFFGNIDVIVGMVEATDPFEKYFISLFLTVIFVVLEGHYLSG